ncbi:hypothetical protein Lal_00042342 [Lupinus albus]|nr:hypothetical protein Lal_00042342 [Lupinus albus]
MELMQPKDVVVASWMFADGSIDWSCHFCIPKLYLYNHFVHSENMAQPPTPPGPRERTLRELAAPDFTYDSLCIQYEDVPYVLKTGLIHLLPKFNGLASQDPHKHLKESHPVAKNTTSEHSNFVHYVAFPEFYYSVHYENMAQPPTPLGPREKTLRELAAPDYTYDSLCIQYEDEPYVLKTGLIHLLPKFNGIAGQDPHKHLKESVYFLFFKNPVAENTSYEHSDSVHYVAFPDFYHSVHSENMAQPPTPPGPPERPIRELDAPDFSYDSLCIKYEGIPYVLKTGLIHLLPKLNGLADYVHSVAFPDFYHSVHSKNMAQPRTPPGPREWPLRELVAPDFTYDSLCIQYEDVPYVLKTGLIHLLPKFKGLAGHDPHKHLKEFVYFLFFKHSVHSENIAHPPSPPGPRVRTLRVLAAPILLMIDVIDANSRLILQL